MKKYISLNGTSERFDRLQTFMCKMWRPNTGLMLESANAVIESIHKLVPLGEIGCFVSCLSLRERYT